MLMDNDLLKHKHTLQQFDAELDHLQGLVVSMTNLLLHQWQLATAAIEDANLNSAMEIISLAKDVRGYESEIDREILILLARESPVANDLRMILSVSKIAMELRILGNEIVCIAKLIIKLNRPRSRLSSAMLLADVIKIPHLIRTLLGNLAVVLSTGQSKQAHLMLGYEFDCECELHETIKHQLSLLNDASQIKAALNVLQILKLMESCGEHCKNIAEYAIFMIDGVDVRHTQNRAVKTGT